jgi:hypothetical protein
MEVEIEFFATGMAHKVSHSESYGRIVATDAPNRREIGQAGSEPGAASSSERPSH